MELSNHPKIQNSNIPTRGFTLVEVMLVVVLILIVTGVAVPKLSGSFSSTRMKDAVRSTIRVARYARSMAILEQADCTLTFATNRISLTSSNATLAVRRLADEIKITHFENLADSSIEGNTVLFYSSGMNDGFEVTFEDEKNRRHTITCNAITGKVTLDED